MIVEIGHFALVLALVTALLKRRFHRAGVGAPQRAA